METNNNINAIIIIITIPIIIVIIVIMITIRVIAQECVYFFFAPTCKGSSSDLP